MSTRPSGRSAKGTACINCRQRKIRCDGARPVCGSCNAALPSACRYSDGGASPDQILREEIAILETRLQELEDPHGPSRLSLNRPDTSSSNSSSSSNRSRHIPLQISLNMRQNLFRSFLPYAAEFGFFLDFPRFSTSLSSSHNHPFPPVVSACQLFGAYLSPINEIGALQSTFLNQALHDAATGLSGSSNYLPQRVLHCVQGEVLLAQYLFVNGRILEGKYRISTAMSMVLGAGFHKIRASNFSGRAGTQSLPPAADAVEEGERVNALWEVIILNSCWTAADGSASNIAYDVPESRIDTPWPLDSYSQTPIPGNVQGSHTIQNFLSNTPDYGRSTMALHAKAAILFEQACLLSRQYRPNMSLPEATRFQQTFNNINRLIRNVASELPPVADYNNSRSATRRLLVIHTLVRVANIRLHAIFDKQDPTSHSQVLSAAQSVVNLLRSVNLNEFPFIDPIMGILWTTTARVFTDEIAFQASSRTARKASSRELMDSLETMIPAMSLFAQRSSLIGSQLELLRQSYTAATR